MINITLIGTSGFLSLHLIAQLGKENCYNLDKNNSAKYPEITIIQDICEANLVHAIPSSTKTIVLLTAKHRDDVYPTMIYYNVNVEGTHNDGYKDKQNKSAVKEKTKYQILFSRSVFILVIFLLSACHDFELTPITDWKQLNHFPGTARASATSFVYQDKAFICLGRSGSRVDFLNDLWEYNSQTDQWLRKTDFPGAARVKAIGATIGDKAYIGLGAIDIGEGNQFNDFWEYDINTDTWKQLATFPGKATNDLFCAVVDDCIYTTEGYTDSQFKPDTYKYDPKTNQWTQLKDCPVKRTGVAGFSIGKNFYVGTGYDIERYKDFYCYHTETNIWSRVADLPKVRVLSKGMSINGQGYIMLGRYWNSSLNGGKLLSDVVRYDPSTNKWSKCGDFPGGARQNMDVFVINGKGYIVGGEDDRERKSDVWVFQP